MTKSYPTLDVLAALTGMMISEQGLQAAHDVLQFMSGKSLYVHQLPVASLAARAYMVKRNPELRATFEEAKVVTPNNYTTWQATWLKRHGETIEAERMGV